MKKITFLFVFLISLKTVFAQQHSLVKLWESDTTFKVPESVCPDFKNKILYVSNIEGTQPWQADGKGSISKLGLDGKVIQQEWIKGLNAPKGMAIYKNTLFVADLTEIIVIDIEKNAIKKKITVPYAQGLNDITVDPNGILYVSDTKAKRIYVVKNDNATPYIETGLQNPNGVLWYNAALYILDKDLFYKVDFDRSLIKLAEGIQGSADGLNAVTPTEFIVSGWAGVLYYIYKDGTKETLLDTRKDQINTADIAFDPIAKIIYVPTFFKNKVVAYQLK